MAIRHLEVDEGKSQHTRFNESSLAHQYLDGLQGIELGAASHNRFSLEGSVNVAPEDDFEFYKRAQVDMDGWFAKVDHYAEADALPFDDGSQDYIISSHVVEHIPDLVAAFAEWNRVLKPGGIIFMIVPKRDALPPDAARPLSTVDDFLKAHVEKWTADTAPTEGVPGERRGHYWVFSLPSMQQLVKAIPTLHWELIEALETDDKVGNGHCVVYRYNPPLFDPEKVVTVPLIITTPPKKEPKPKKEKKNATQSESIG